MGNKLNKFSLLMWKNWTMMRRRPIHTAFEVIYPVLICLILVGVRSLIFVEEKPVTIYKPFSIKPNMSQYPCVNPVCFRNKFVSVAYSPESTFFKKVINTVCGTTNIVPFQNTKKLNEAVINNTNICVAIQFDDSLSNVRSNSELPSNINITLRPLSEDNGTKVEWFTKLLYPVFRSPGPRSADSKEGGEPGYYERGFLFLQKELTMALMSYGRNLTFPDLLMQRYPYTKWLNDFFYNSALETMVSMLLMISFMYNFINTVRAITSEKEKQLKESMKIMGLPGWLHWVAWFLRTFIILLIAIIVIVIIVKINFRYSAVFTRSDPSVLFIFLLIFSCSMITFTFLISVFFSKANTAAAVGSLIFFLSYLPYSLQAQDYDDLSLLDKLGSSLLANTALSFGVSLILKLEAIEEGAQWSGLFTSLSPDDSLTLGAIFLMLLLDTFLYLIVALYVEAIFPGEFGVPQPWYFPFTRTYWCKTKYTESLELGLLSGTESEFFEKFTEDLPKGIQLKHLTKIFGINTAVNNLNLDMYEGHITVLLGHNGAGKTTTMSMITGMFPPTKGTAIVSGYDVRTSIARVRDSMGLCLQHNVLFDHLTVWEHLYFFGKLKGLESKEIDAEIDNYLKLLELEDKRNSPSNTLSGGMKRKLSVAVALCGKSKVVMLDEPTAGMDPSARRTVWNLLQKQKQGRTILLTTHFMDEADLLGDRIAIMTGGNLQCCGSSFFLKKKYGAGYYLIMDVLPQCVPENITELLRKYIPDINVQSHVGSELTYLLSESYSGKFEKMLHDLESNTTNLGVQSYGVSLTTLEEVFMKVGADHDNEVSRIVNEQNGDSTDVTIEGLGANNSKQKSLQGFALLRNQFLAMFLKKVFSQLRSWYLLLFQVGLPVALLVITVLSSEGAESENIFPALRITLDSYITPKTLISADNKGDQYYIAYKSMISEPEIVDNITKAILDLTEKTPAIVKRNYIVGASFGNNNVTAWFNGDPYHSVPLALSLMLKVLYQVKLGSSKTINFINHPLPLTYKTKLSSSQFNVVGFQMSIALGYGMAFVASFYVLFVIKERVSKSKHLQFVSGANVVVFWCTSFLCDLLTYLITMSAILIAVAALQQDGFSTPEEIGRLTLIFVYFGFFVLPFLYLLSYLFTVPSTGFSRVMLFGAVTGIIAITVMQVLEIDTLNLLDLAHALHWILLFVPFYTISKAIYDVSTLYTRRIYCSQSGGPLESACTPLTPLCCGLDNYYSLQPLGIGRNILISFSMSIILFAVLIINENGVFTAIKNKIINSNKPPVQNDSIDSDVEDENFTIQTTSPSILNEKYALVLRDVTKYYKNFLAVNGLCLGVKPYECFGLLGVNGAGKTTTFKMMTGDEQISYGDAWVKGLSIKRHQKEVQKLIGYCPQFDALLDDLTVKETLTIFALIRGVPYSQCKELGENLAHEFDFYKHINKKVKELSGGNKRKLSTALALIGDPLVIYLDEPTTGMDPATKRYLWTALGKIRDKGKCIVLTSHSMEECEALCTRLAIMVNGNFQCLGSTQRLKNKFAQGYALTIKIKKTAESVNLEDEIAAIDSFIKENFPGAVLKEKYQELVSYQLVNSSIPWSQMFGILEKSKKYLNIEDYSLGQCSLEQVFLSFTKYQR